MLILGGDPSKDHPGYAVWSVLHQTIVYADVVPPTFVCEVAVFESGWPHGPMGKVQMWGLGFDAGWRLAQITADAKYTIKPKAWRAALGIPSSPPKAVIVARLRALRYAGVPGVQNWTDDVVEAAGIAEATAILLARKFKKDRAGLVEVKR